MTVIAWDGRTLACDSQGTEADGTISAVEKIWSVDGETLIAAAGVVAEGLEMKRWYLDGAEPERFPTLPGYDKLDTVLVVVTAEAVRAYHQIPYPVLYAVDDPHAWGGASQIARTAMYLGKGAKRACEIACELSVRCGAPVVAHDLKGRAKRGRRA